MLTRYLSFGPLVKNAGNVTANIAFTVTPNENYSRYFILFECANPANVPVIVRNLTIPSHIYVDCIHSFGLPSGKMIAPFSINEFSVDTQIVFSEDAINVQVYATHTAEFLYLGHAVGPVSISTAGPLAFVPFSVAITCEPLFLEPQNFLQFYTGPTGLATGLQTFITGLLDDYEFTVAEKAISKEVQIAVSYEEVDEGDPVGKVISRTPRIAEDEDSAPKYTIVADVVIGIPEGGYQDPVVIGAENPANYLKRKYVPKRGSHDELGYVPMSPIVLTCDSLGEIQASGRLVYEHSTLLVGEPRASRYCVTVNVIEGAGSVAIYDNEQEFAELTEYEQ